jgi:hypothetical protein
MPMKDRKEWDNHEEYRIWKEKVPDRRRWERYPPGQGVLALLDGYTYRLIDISLGGLSLYDYRGKAFPEEGVLSLHSTEKGFFLDTLRCRKVSENQFVICLHFGRERIHKVSLKILDTDPDLDQKLMLFMGKQ